MISKLFTADDDPRSLLPTIGRMYATLAIAIVLRLISPALAMASDDFSVTEIPFNRTLPHAFHDQAVASISSIHPDGEVLIAERIAYVGDFLYALVVYRKETNAPDAHLDAVAVGDVRAWRLQGVLPAGDLKHIQGTFFDCIKKLH